MAPDAPAYGPHPYACGQYYLDSIVVESKNREKAHEIGRRKCLVGVGKKLEGRYKVELDPNTLCAFIKIK